MHCGKGDYSLDNKYRDPKYEPRPHDKSKNIGAPSFYFRERTDLERIKVILS